MILKQKRMRTSFTKFGFIKSTDRDAANKLRGISHLLPNIFLCPKMINLFKTSDLRTILVFEKIGTANLLTDELQLSVETSVDQ